jgi:hypothetical protein
MATRSFISVRVGDPHPGEEHLVELGLAGDLPQRPDLHPGGGHVAQEVGDALVLGQVRVGAGDEDRPAGVVGAGRPHLLAVHDPVVAVPDRPGAQPRQVGARAGFGEQLAPDLLAGPQRPQEALLLLLGAVAQDGRGGHAEADADAPRVVVGRAGGGQFGVHDALQRAGRAEAAEALGKVHPGQARVEAGPQEVQGFRRGGIVGAEERAHPRAQVLVGRGAGRHGTRSPSARTAV